ncbi:hypothetical protein K461DRAFT_67215 [Myriangium duriaei CBS 260.36]|uniref:PNPLA domain-containing protein n=1 Tax=Myriangium duriaei CBS 260.36 TaxID=1168546 RepID=A0A9P4MCA3_9PEZI|nr:hypothetical protein K461DRAFT_67215 [Myriangium duriaei CBS 260.36]
MGKQAAQSGGGDSAAHPLLSLDGGGVRGLSSLYILKGIMQLLNHGRKKQGQQALEPFGVFHLIGGTGTGG